MTSSAVVLGESSKTNHSFLVASLSIAAFFVLLTVFINNPIVDEGLHLLAVQRLLNGNWHQPDFLPMPLTYHFLVYLPAKVFGAEVWVLRLVNTILSIALLWVVQSIHRVQKSGHDERLLHVAWLPVLFPFTVLAYTEVASLLLLLAGVLLHLCKKPALSALPLTGACMVRQSNIVWVAFIAAWGALEAWQRYRRDRSAGAPLLDRRQITTILSQVWPQLIILIAASVFFLVNGGFNITAVEANRIRFNSAQFYLFALTLVGLWGPIWVPRLAKDFIALGRWAGRQPKLGGAVILLSLLAAAGATTTYWNPHPWNHNPNFLRNWLLVLLERSIVARGFAAMFVLIALPGLVRRTFLASNRTLLLLTWAFSFAYIAPHSLVDPRYYILPLVMLQFFSGFEDKEAQRLTIWYAIVSATVSSYVIISGHRLGGLL